MSALELTTIPISHYCEKARWALDWAGIPYRERAHIQVIHRVHALRAGRSLTVPVLDTPEGKLTESADIVEYADRHAGNGRRLIPRDAEQGAEVRALVGDFDERLGPHGRRWMYDSTRGSRSMILKYAPTGVPAWERRILPAFLPLMTFAIDRVLDVDPKTAAHSLQVTREVFDEVGERLADGRAHLVGEGFSAADLTFAALSAPVVLPDRYGVPLPRLDEIPAAMAAVVEELRAHPAGAFALRMYDEERG